LTEEPFILFLLAKLFPITISVFQIVVAGDIVDHYCLMFERGVVHIVVAGYIVDHYCFMFDRGVVHIVVAGYGVDRLLFEV
jgi:hypothetical protein